MFDFFNKRTAKDFIADANETYGLPEPAKTPKIPEVEKDPVTFYRIGLTDNNRVSFQMGYSEITMNAGGINAMIKMLESARDQIETKSPSNYTEE
jgi:hypothetical protein